MVERARGLHERGNHSRVDADALLPADQALMARTVACSFKTISEGVLMPEPRYTALLLLAVSALAPSCATAPRTHAPTAREQCEEWRVQHRTIDLHQHVNYTT